MTIPGPNGRPYHPNIVLGLDNNGISTVDGITFLGAPTPRQNVDGEPTEINGKPASPVVQDEALYRAGQALAATCKAEYTKTGILPIVITNSREQSYQILYNGCASATLSGEGPTGIFTYSSPVDGNQANVIVQGSSGGNGSGCGFWPYQKITSGAQYNFYLVNDSTNRIEYYSTVMISNSGHVTITPLQPIRNNPYNPGVVNRFLETSGSYAASPSDNQVGSAAAC